MKKVIKIDQNYNPEKDWEEIKEWLRSIGIYGNYIDMWDKSGSLIIEWVED